MRIMYNIPPIPPVHRQLYRDFVKTYRNIQSLSVLSVCLYSVLSDETLRMLSQELHDNRANLIKICSPFVHNTGIKPEHSVAMCTSI